MLGEESAGLMALGAAGSLESGENRLLNLLLIKGDFAAVTLTDIADAHVGMTPSVWAAATRQPV